MNALEPARRRAIWAAQKPVAIETEVRHESSAVSREATSEEKVIDPRACPKCGVIYTRGHWSHVKYCNGIP